MANELPEPRPGYNRRSFLKLASVGIAAAAALTLPLKGLLGGRRGTRTASSDFPGEDSIFHPRQDPREVAEERKGRQA